MPKQKRNLLLDGLVLALAALSCALSVYIVLNMPVGG